MTVRPPTPRVRLSLAASVNRRRQPETLKRAEEAGAGVPFVTQPCSRGGKRGIDPGIDVQPVDQPVASALFEEPVAHVRAPVLSGNRRCMCSPLPKGHRVWAFSSSGHLLMLRPGRFPVASETSRLSSRLSRWGQGFQSIPVPATGDRRAPSVLCRSDSILDKNVVTLYRRNSYIAGAM